MGRKQFRIITWMSNSFEHSMGAHLALYETTKEVWDHLQRLYTLSKFAKRYQLEIDILFIKGILVFKSFILL